VVQRRKSAFWAQPSQPVTGTPARLRRMCGRYSNARTNPQAIAARFNITISDATAERALGRTNIAPTQPVLAVVNGDNGERQAILARFGSRPRGRSCVAARR
jgi:hypothetical protein